MESWSFGAENLPCGNCGHQHERSKVQNNRLEFSPCKVMTTSRDEEGKLHKNQCTCSMRV